MTLMATWQGMPRRVSLHVACGRLPVRLVKRCCYCQNVTLVMAQKGPLDQTVRLPTGSSASDAQRRDVISTYLLEQPGPPEERTDEGTMFKHVRPTATALS
jgi:hypothetical protein